MAVSKSKTAAPDRRAADSGLGDSRRSGPKQDTNTLPAADGRFDRVPARAWDHIGRIGTSGYAVLAAIAHHARRGTDEAYPSASRIRQFTGLSVRQIHRLVKELETVGLLKVTRVSGRSNRFRVLFTTPVGGVTSDTHLTGTNAEPVTPVSPTRDSHVRGPVTPVSPKPDEGTRQKNQSTTRRGIHGFPLKIGTWQLSEAKVAEWSDTHATLDVEAELRRARQWLRDNPRKRKTAGGMHRFLGGWLSRAVEKRRSGARTGPDKARPPWRRRFTTRRTWSSSSPTASASPTPSPTPDSQS
ncbi:MAG: helix-turn-helix domain-containing protein [Acidobacteria bacterium]|nr:helix-turn-helix domain-containing protein [Acidobacteriota bacterium]